MKILSNFNDVMIPCNSAVERSIVLQFLLDLGYKWHGWGYYTLERINTEYSYNKWRVLLIEVKSKRISGRRDIDEKYQYIDGADLIATYELRILPADEASNISVGDMEGVIE